MKHSIKEVVDRWGHYIYWAILAILGVLGLFLHDARAITVFDYVESTTSQYHINDKKIGDMIVFIDEYISDCDVNYLPKLGITRRKQITKGIDNIKFDVNFKCGENAKHLNAVNNIKLIKLMQTENYIVNLKSNNDIIKSFNYYP